MGPREDFMHFVVAQCRALYREPDILAHYSNPDRLAHLEEEPWALAVAKTHVRKGGHILAVGCGAGTEAFWYVEAGYSVTGVDVVPELVEIARGRARKKGVAERVRFEIVDGYTWPLKDESCDGVSLMQNFLVYLPSKAISPSCAVEVAIRPV